MPLVSAVLSLKESERIVSAVVGSAASSGRAVSVAVVNDAGLLMNFLRMDGAVTSSINAAIDKGYTSAVLGLATKDLMTLMDGDPSLMAGLPMRPRFVVFGGGVPVISDGHILGGVGVSGAPNVDVDHDLALHGCAVALQIH